ncbi:MAG TPA: dienelactone hydrolase family protein, partial [Cytophagales bacterium]|nr:dienelactone hydrolase family protein [Cytophagales bacterium]
MWGLNDYIKKQSEKLFNDLGNVNILAIDMYDGKIATNPDSARKYATSFDPERGKNLIKGALSHVGKNAKVGTIGWCFGGGWSLQASILAENQGIGCVIYYGMPEKDINQLKKLQAPVLGIFASKEEHISPQIVREFISNMKKADKK